MIIAEESSSYPNICKKVVDGGLGFDFKWNMGWMNDIIKYMNMDPLFRKDNHKALTFPIYYQYTENFILPLVMMRLFMLKDLCLIRCLVTMRIDLNS